MSQRIPGTIYNLAASTTAAGTKKQVSATAYGSQYVVVTAKPGNTGLVYVGGADVSSSLWLFRLAPASACMIPIDRVDRLWYDVSVNSEGIQAGYLA